MDFTIISGVTAVALSLVATFSSFLSSRLFNKKQQSKVDLDKYIDAINSSNIKYEQIYHTTSKKASSIDRQLIEAYLSDLKETKKAEVQITEKLITSYHEQAISQSRTQFYVSIFAAILGFGLIIASFFIWSGDGAAVILRAMPGVIINAVAYLFFRQAEDIRKRATDLYDRLRNDNQKQVAISVAATIDDINLQSRVKAQIALHIAGLPNEVLEPVSAKKESGETVGRPQEK